MTEKRSVRVLTEKHVQRCIHNRAAETPGERPESTRVLRDERERRAEQAPKKTRRRRLRSGRPVPETDTGGRVEHTKALERFTVKELGKLAP